MTPGSLRHGDGNVEVAALAERALYPDAATVQFHDSLGDGETKADAAPV